ncbi:MAG: threonylcarbamoyl-AMP synthase [Anaerolineae bacterium]|nr:threonylcarbamoyl-AMP synthase [Anaerolineae bacterium]
MGEIVSASAPDALERAMVILRSGGVVAFPTDTVYGVGVHAFVPAAVARLYQVKRRPTDRPIPILLADPEDMEMVARDISPLAWELARLFWPGPLSLVLPRHPRVPDEVVAGGNSVAVRIPDHMIPQRLARLLHAPLAASSANLSGGPNASTAQEVMEQIGQEIDLVIDGGPCPGGVPSTILDLTSDPPRLLRQGPITRAMLADVIPQLCPVKFLRDEEPLNRQIE